MDLVPLTVQARAQDSAAKDLRRSSVVPCVLYGNDTDNTALQCDHNELFRAYAKAGESSLVELDTGSKKVPVLFHAIDFDPVSDKIIHVDFYAVDMKKEIETNVQLQFIGEAPAVKDLGGVLVTALDHVTVRCLPADLPHVLEVDVSKIETFSDAVTVADIQVPERVAVLAEEDRVVATAQEPRRVEEEVTETAEEGEEGEEGAEGGEGEGGEAAAEEGGEGGDKKDE